MSWQKVIIWCGMVRWWWAATRMSHDVQNCTTLDILDPGGAILVSECWLIFNWRASTSCVTDIEVSKCILRALTWISSGRLIVLHHDLIRCINRLFIWWIEHLHAEGTYAHIWPLHLFNHGSVRLATKVGRNNVLFIFRVWKSFG